ncbi:metal-dependent hydrolase [Myxococcota bacterium]|nr:metal-dependent hydrolase [Myxococcota bacterium]MBU1381050.1 metal-dependent hydrolase [Myxococcota bacterium]MBU1495429.1 metal-dependent hydrolase [Myxococcota bacterium]
MTEINCFLQKRWERTFPGEIEEFQIIQAKYSEPHRYYHTLKHVYDCIRLLDSLTVEISRIEVETALWFHDVVYDPKRKDNEHASAEFFKSHRVSAIFDTEFRQRICRMIENTACHLSDQSIDESIMIDIDLSILGSSFEKYNEYAELIRLEYSFVDDDTYRNGRKKVLESFLSREFIYSTPPFRQTHEKNARNNILSEIKTLSP